MIIGVAVVAAALSGCASPQAQPNTAEPRAADARIAAATADAIPAQNTVRALKVGGKQPGFVPSGDARVTVDGTVLNMPGPVYCFTNKGVTQLLINVGPKKVSGGHAMVKLDPNSQAVQMFDIQTAELIILLREEDNVGEQITATKDGDSFHIEGEGPAIDSGVKKTMTYVVDVNCAPGWNAG
ncbi:lipoprotein LpqH [Mycobacteroides immunogenum]|uniref:Uncharacterized protein n=1 Tax=Mycobacteroides immunogenum TaxID=83262 RepID=A0A7V8LSX3_9MYCO|nr:lipoprotein LpqH [Mycobacteroides immunogenum]AMT71323.1 hypothetical protein ABG82_14395 [Mycobacteroides immunogenum]ANO04432.1 hypothetical protein BAB75_14620 [Mycobacteroides immunogenum]KIU42484.1 hypothetical protein TL11_01505 [Mycobacteroides immunogenum]KPG14927.1 hypothetical protein AN909_00650 [Mycobacteroides immunogenum]KPG15543.1 hypothetical protein AN910_05800 [Mycobacteroides immunogenum]